MGARAGMQTCVTACGSGGGWVGGWVDGGGVGGRAHNGPGHVSPKCVSLSCTAPPVPRRVVQCVLCQISGSNPHRSSFIAPRTSVQGVFRNQPFLLLLLLPPPGKLLVTPRRTLLPDVDGAVGLRGARDAQHLPWTCGGARARARRSGRQASGTGCERTPATPRAATVHGLGGAGGAGLAGCAGLVGARVGVGAGVLTGDGGCDGVPPEGPPAALPRRLGAVGGPL